MKILMTEDFTATLQDNQKDFLKLMFDGALSAAHSAAAQYLVHRDEFDKLDFIANTKAAFNYQNLGGFESNPLLDDLTEMYSDIMNAAADR
ncbi:MAG: hypothetical protein KH613_03090 [Veillonella sp.]|uniref:hypothetical protein n=1 Tax=Veillonella sp. TaxID=1926307 RepID=UPI001D857C99|nr:hypothetical protein [Veillonella sp.]MBS6186129.1 hypothetical protein [Veillonella sp.]